MRWGEIRQTEGIDFVLPMRRPWPNSIIRPCPISVKSTIYRQLVGIGPSAYGDHALHTAKAKQAQPIRNANPPSGVIAPSHLSPVQLKR